MTDITDPSTNAPPAKRRGRPPKPKVEAGPKKRGRPVGSKNKVTKKKVVTRKSKYLPYEEAREYVHNEMIESRLNYETWWQRTKPKVIPRYPYRVYENKGWTSWNDFLGVNNKFEKKRIARWRKFEEAVVWAHTLGLSTSAEWTEYAKSGNKPDDIPARPDVTYIKWVSWSHWLGYKPVERIKVAEENHGIYYVIHEQGFPSNVLTYGIETGGLYYLKARWDREPYDIIRFFKFRRDKAERVTQIVQSLTTSYPGYEKQRITPNFHDVIWYLESELEPITDLSVTEGRRAAPGSIESSGLMPLE